jgi:hypothetical protein
MMSLRGSLPIMTPLVPKGDLYDLHDTARWVGKETKPDWGVHFKL